MENSQYFNFEEENTDFPFYKNENFFSKKMGLPLLISVLLFIFLITGPVKFPNFQEQVILFLVTIIPVLYVMIEQRDIFFKTPKKEDIHTLIVSYFGIFLLLFIIMAILQLAGLSSLITHQSFAPELLNIWGYIFEFIQIIGEELFRVFIFLMALYLLYKYTQNRKLSIILATIIALLVFGAMHVNSYDNMIYNLLIIGLGGFFEFYPYLKTKNVLLSIILHVLYNLTVILVHAI